MFGVFQRILEGSHRLLRLEDIEVSQLPKGQADRLRRAQIRGAIEQMRVFVAGNTFFAPVLSFQAWNTGINAVVVLWTALMLAFSWWLFFQWTKSYQTKGSAADMQRFVNETKLNAFLWGLGFILFYPFVSGDQKTIILTVITGSLALGTVGFAQAPRASVWYLGISTLVLVSVTLTSGILRQSSMDYLLSFLALVAGGAIFNVVLEHARAQMHAFKAHEDVIQKSEVIDLLLKDYEQQSVEWIWRTDAAGRIVTCPDGIREMFGDGARRIEGTRMIDALTRSCTGQGKRELARAAQALEARQDFHDVVLPLCQGQDGQTRWIMMRGRPQYEQGRFAGFRGIFADTTVRVEAQRQVAFLAENDPLTGTANRNTIQARLDALRPDRDRAMAYLIDLDGFKQVNDSYGHATGDELLRHVANRLTEIVGDRGLVARLGGDEFFVLIEDVNALDRFNEDCLIDQFLASLSRPFAINPYDIALSGSIGTARFPEDTKEGEALLNLADLALYSAKKGGRNRCVAFIHKMQTGLQKRMMLTDRLRQAVKQNEIQPYYQPQYDSQTRELVGFEALARWSDPDLGIVGPDIFIPIAEETGLIHEIGESLLRRACADALSWSMLNGSGRPLRLSVNASPVQVQRGRLVEMVGTVLAQTGLPAHQLEIEVTESTLIEDMSGTCQTLSDLAALGVSVALDDFGTGYSSLSYLRALPLHRLKIDRSFIKDLDQDHEAVSVVQTIIDLCIRLELDVVAEGIETEAAAQLLAEMKCGTLQGYYFSRPLPAHDIRQLIKDTHSSVA